MDNQKAINDLLSQIQLMYLRYCLPYVEVRRNKEVIIGYKWVSIEMEQIYRKKIFHLADLAMK